MSVKTWHGKKIASIGFTGLVLGAVLVIGRNVQRGSAAQYADQITVTVSGEIMKPGPIRLPKGSTIEYLLLQVRPKSTALVEGLELTKVLLDGDRVSVPRKVRPSARTSKNSFETLDRYWANALTKAEVPEIQKMLGVEKGIAAEIGRLAEPPAAIKGSIRWATDILLHPNVLQARWEYPKWVNSARRYAESHLQESGEATSKKSPPETATRD